MSEADKRQEGGSHYKNRPIQPWNLIIPMEWSAFQFEIINYVDRYKRKGGIEDLKKARHWLDKLIEIEGAAAKPPEEEFKLTPIDQNEILAGIVDYDTREAARKILDRVPRPERPFPPQINGASDDGG